MAMIPPGAPSWRDEPDDDRERRLNEVIAGYLEEIEAGRRPDRAGLMARHPDLASELASFLANREHLERLTAPLRERRPGVETPAVLPFPAAGSSVDVPEAGRVGYFGDYELVEVLAEGGMGVVYRARQVSLDRLLALKMIRSGRFATPDDLQRFRREAEAAAQLDHPHIVPIYEVGVHEGHHYFSMKLVDGGSLAARVGRFAEHPRAAASLVATVARAVHEAHRRGIIHRDLKPANILLARKPDEPPERWTPMVADFGLAKRLEGVPAAGFTQSGSIVGTPGYMAPEQAEGTRGAITTAVDIHALGAILYELLAGRPPFRGSTALETLRLVREAEPSRLRGLNARVDRDLETIVFRCLEKAPSRRYPSADALADDLDLWLAGRPIHARPANLPERLVKWARRRPTVAALLLVGVVAMSASAMAVGGLLAWDRESRRRRQAERDLAGTVRQQERIRADDYFHRILAADRALDAHDPDGAARLLDGCPPSLRGWEWRHLSRRLRPERLVIRGHSGFLCAEDYAPGRRGDACRAEVLPGSVWDASPDAPGHRHADPSGSVARRIHGLDGTAYGLALDRRGIRLATAGADGVIRAWDVLAGRMTVLIRAHDGWASGVAFSPDGARLATAGADGRVRIWDVGPGGEAHGRKRDDLAGHDGPVFGVAFSPDGARVASAGSDGTVRVWEPARGPSAAIAVLRGHDREVMAVAFHPDGTRLASGGADRRVRIWDLAAGREWASFDAGTGHRIDAIAYDPTGARLAVGGHDRSVAIWDVGSRSRLIDYPGHSAPVLYVGFGPGGKVLASASQDATIKLWDPDSGPGVRPLRAEAMPGPDGSSEPPRWVGGLAFDRSGRELAAAGTGGTVATWDAEGRLTRRLRAGSGPIVAVAYRPDGLRLAAAGTERTVRFWDLRSGGTPRELSDWREGFSSLAYRPDGGMLATGGGEPPRIIQVPAGKWSPPEGDGRTIRLWDPSDGREIRALHGHVGPVHALAFRPDGDILASAGADGTVRLWDPDSGRLLAEHVGHAGPVFALAFNPDGALLASAGSDRAIRLWDVVSGRVVKDLSGHGNWVLGLAFSPDGCRLASAGADGTVRLWDPDRGREVLSLHGPGGRVHGVAFSPDGDRLAAAGDDGVVRVWEARSP